MQPPAIRFQEVSLGFHGKLLFDRFSLKITGGRCTCLLGPSGCGKSTMLGLVSGNSALRYSGRVYLDPENGTTQAIGWMAQSDLLLPWLTVLDNVLLGSKLRAENRPDLQRQAETLLVEAGLAGKGDLLPGQLSGGMRQRVALLRTLMEDRPVILMDEPFSALDTLTRIKLQNLAARMTRGKTVLMVTHDPLEALRLADRIIVLQDMPVRISSVIDLHGSTPRNPDDPELQETYPQLLRQLLAEVKE